MASGQYGTIAGLFYGAIILSAQHRLNGGFAKPLFDASRQRFREGRNQAASWLVARIISSD
jgi:hypothetical protein